MSISLSLKRMKSLLALSAEKRDMKWAHDVCTASRFIHIDVWKFCVPRKDVETKVIPLLEEAKKELVGLRGKKDFDDDKLTEYETNDIARIRNLSDNYMKGRPSGFRPGDKISEPGSQAG